MVAKKFVYKTKTAPISRSSFLIHTYIHNLFIARRDQRHRARLLDRVGKFSLVFAASAGSFRGGDFSSLVDKAL